jgi:hypothetical protein
VLWVEQLPEVFARLQSNIAPYPSLRAVQALPTDEDGQPHQLLVSNNQGQSSSIFDLKKHRNLYFELYGERAHVPLHQNGSCRFRELPKRVPISGA